MTNEVKEQVITKFIKGDKEMISACFDEYYFEIREVLIKPDPINAKEFHIGDNVPTKGETYSFPKDFNIIDLHFKLVAKIREGKLYDVIAVEDYEYDNYPALNMMGFSIDLKSKEDFEEFKIHFRTFTLVERDKLAEFANKWFDITSYRKIRYR